MTTQALAKINDGAKHDELIQLVSFDLDQEFYFDVIAVPGFFQGELHAAD